MDLNAEIPMWDYGTCAQTPGLPAPTFPSMQRRNVQLCWRSVLAQHRSHRLVNKSNARTPLGQTAVFCLDRLAHVPQKRTRKRLLLCLCPCLRSETWILPTMPTRFWSPLWGSFSTAPSLRTRGGTETQCRRRAIGVLQYFMCHSLHFGQVRDKTPWGSGLLCVCGAE